MGLPASHLPDLPCQSLKWRLLTPCTQLLGSHGDSVPMLRARKEISPAACMHPCTPAHQVLGCRHYLLGTSEAVQTQTQLFMVHIYYLICKLQIKKCTYLLTFIFPSRYGGNDPYVQILPLQMCLCLGIPTWPSGITRRPGLNGKTNIPRGKARVHPSSTQRLGQEFRGAHTC